jgi:F0F1-type ATP synthase membrane subunit b/b'
MTISERPIANPAREAIRNIKLMTGTMRGLMALADQLGEVNDLDAMIAERSSNVAKLLAQKLELEARVAQLDSEITNRLSEAKAEADVQHDLAADTRAAADAALAEAKARLAAATTQAATIVENAKAAAREAVANEISAIKARL